MNPVMSEISAHEEILREAALVLRNMAESASTGERWESQRHYDALYALDFKPSVELEDVTDYGTLGSPHFHDYEQPVVTYVGAPQALYAALVDPQVGIEWAKLLEYAADNTELRGFFVKAAKTILRKDSDGEGRT